MPKKDPTVEQLKLKWKLVRMPMRIMLLVMCGVLGFTAWKLDAEYQHRVQAARWEQCMFMARFPGDFLLLPVTLKQVSGNLGPLPEYCNRVLPECLTLFPIDARRRFLSDYILRIYRGENQGFGALSI